MRLESTDQAPVAAKSPCDVDIVQDSLRDHDNTLGMSHATPPSAGLAASAPKTTSSASPSGPRGRAWGLSLLGEMEADFLGFSERLHVEYGDISRFRVLNEDIWDLMSPKLVREFMVGHASEMIRWERGVEVFSDLFGQGVLTTEGATWQRQRRMLMPAFTPKAVAGYTVLMTQAADQAFGHLDQQVSEQRPAIVDMPQLWSRLAMGAILRTLFGTAGTDQTLQAIDATQTLAHMGYRESFWPKSVPAWLPTAYNRRKRNALASLWGLVQNHIDQHPIVDASGAPQRNDLLTQLQTLRDPDTGEALSAKEIFDQCLVTFQAGHSTVASTLLWWSYAMARHPHVQQRAREEVLAAWGQEKPTLDHLERVPFLVATLKEAMRLYPAAPVLMSRRTTANIPLEGWHIPKGAMVRIAPWVLHRDERFFANALTYQPERFLDGGPPIERGAWIPFGLGPRVCLGQHFAMSEMTLAAGMFLQRFTLPTAPSESDWRPAFHIVLEPSGPGQLQVQSR